MKWQVTATVTGCKSLGEFEAETEEEAIALAEISEGVYISLCHQCADECSDAECTKFHADAIGDDNA
jgi:hypothetical protein